MQAAFIGDFKDSRSNNSPTYFGRLIVRTP
jgi:hypothetical protein